MGNSYDTVHDSIRRAVEAKQHLIDVAAGRTPADLVLKNAVYLNVFAGELNRGDIAVAAGRIAGMGRYSGTVEYNMAGRIVLPGLIDGHMHLESSLLSPRELAHALLPHGTTTVVTDPHEIANVMGVDGIAYMLQATEGLPIDVQLMLPSCVPATPMDESGAVLDYLALEPFYGHPRVRGLAEVMDFVGVINGESRVLEKIAAAQSNHKKIDGHAPDLCGAELDAYVAAGVYSDHECHDVADAIAKIGRGQYIMIREGTAAQNLEALLPLLTPKYAARCLFCVDDRHPSDLLDKGHIDYICRRAIALGADPVLTATVATHNAARYYQLNDRGAIAPGYLADLAVIDNFENFRVQTVFRQGRLCYDGQVADFPAPQIDPDLIRKAHDTFHLQPLTADDFRDRRQRGILGMLPGEIVTTDNGYASQVDLERDILKLAVVERHKHTGHIGLGYLQGYGLRTGAIATSISHDSHNIIVVGTNSRDMAVAANQVARNRGGIVVVKDQTVTAQVVLELAGIMTDAPLVQVNGQLEHAKTVAFSQGVTPGVDPFMTLSFMALPVIPQLRLTTRGVIDVMTQKYL